MIRAAQRTGAQKFHEKLLRPLLGPLLLALGFFYFTFHALSGERGIYALLKEDRKLEVLKAELATVTRQRKDLENRTRLMSDPSLDRDLLDEQSRIMLNDAQEDEYVIMLPHPAPAPASPVN